MMPRFSNETFLTVSSDWFMAAMPMKLSHLDHVGQQRVLRAAERLDALDGQQVRGDARDACAHAVEHLAQLLQVGLAGGVVDRGRAPGQHGGHDDVGRARYGASSRSM